MARCLRVLSDIPPTPPGRNRRDGGTEKPSSFSSWIPTWTPVGKEGPYRVRANSNLRVRQRELAGTRGTNPRGQAHGNTSLPSSLTTCFTLQQSQQPLCSCFKRADEVRCPAQPAGGSPWDRQCCFQGSFAPSSACFPFPFHSTLGPALPFQALFTEATRSINRMLSSGTSSVGNNLTAERSHPKH